MLLHHVMGGLEGMRGAWAYVEGGMGALSEAIASSATAHGASIFTEKVNSPLPRFLQGSENRTISDSEGPSLSRWARQGSESGFRALQPVSGLAALNQVPVLLPAPLEVQRLSQPLHWRRGWLRPHLGAAENRQRVRKLVVPVSSTMAKSPKTQPACPFPGFPGLQTVASVQVSSGGRVQGVVLQDGSEVRSRVVLSNASPQSTFLKLTPQEWLPEEFVQRISQLDTQSPVTKINVAVNRLPNFLAAPNTPRGQPLPHHQCSTHLNCEDTLRIHQAFEDAVDGLPSHRPIIELCIPSSLDPTLAPPGCHVISLFTQYTPYTLAGGKAWDELERNTYADRVFDCIEAYAPGFKGSVVGRDILTPPDLERIFDLPGGNIFHCAMTLDQLYFARPVPLHSSYRCPLPGLYLCGSGAHPGGGVMGAAGRNAARVVFRDLRSM